jgi:hypothetical protein
MNQALPSSIDQLWHSPTLPMWLTVVAACFFAIVLLVTLFRAERSVANGALTVITLLAIGIAVATMMRASGGRGSRQAVDIASSVHSAAALPALSCLDGLAGESVENACEKALFASADTAAAAVSYTAAQVTKLASFGNVAAADKMMTPELNALRRTIERDRYGLVAHVLTTRDGCSLSAPCPFFQSLTNSAQISSNMTEDLYDGTVERHTAAWAAAPLPGTANVQGAPLAALGTVPPPGRPVSGDFPSASSIPPISIMSPEPSGQGSQSAPRSAEKSDKPEKEKVETIVSTPARSSPGATLIPQPAPTPTPAAKSPPAAAKKPAPPKSRAQTPAQTPVQLAPPPAQSEDNN